LFLCILVTNGHSCNWTVRDWTMKLVIPLMDAKTTMFLPEFESDFCVSCASYITTMLTMENALEISPKVSLI